MICMYVESYLSIFIFVFYSCIWIPFIQTTHSIRQIFTLLLNPHHRPEKPDTEETQSCQLDLPVSRFQDLEFCSKHRGAAMDNQEEEECSICLMEFEKEDLVNKVPRCGHVFHMECMEKWLDRCQFTCPLCRSLLLHATNKSSPCKMGACVSAPFS
ncbi:hypothetical protein ACP275_13G140000 [Erythranthe tilingii]